MKDFGGSEFSTFASKTENLLSEFNECFPDSEAVKKDILLYNNPLTVAIKEQPALLQLELCDLQANSFFIKTKENGRQFFRHLSSKGFPNLRTFGLRTTSMFGSTHLCESAFSNISFIKSHHCGSLMDDSLLSRLRCVTTEIQVDIQSSVADSKRPQCSHNN